MAAKKNIFIFGDSITYGEWDSEGGWANRLRTYYDSQVLPLPDDYIVTYNLGIPGDTSSGVAQRLTQETEARLVPVTDSRDLQFVIAIGTNDSRFTIDENKRVVEKEQFKENLERITAAAKQFSNDIVFIGLLPCVEEYVLETANRMQWLDTFDNQSIRVYNEMIKQHCLESKIKFIDLNNVFENYDANLLLDDGLHPNTKGHALVYDAIVKQLDKT